MDTKRIECQKSVTDTLMKAMENADNMAHVIIIYETHEDNKTFSGGIYTQDDVTLARINWLLDCGKRWVWKGLSKNFLDKYGIGCRLATVSP